MRQRLNIQCVVLFAVICGMLISVQGCLFDGGDGRNNGGPTDPNTSMTLAVKEWETVYASADSIGCCKERCDDAVRDGLENCWNSDTRTVLSVPVSGSQFRIEGLVRTFAGICHDTGKVIASLNGVTKEQSIRCFGHYSAVPQQFLTFQFTFDSPVSGTLDVTTVVSDWCTSLDAVAVFQR